MIFSIIIPVYKTEKYLNDCVQSVLSQSFTDYECILIDDGSPDNCPSLCDDFSKKDNRIKVIHKENGGLSDARNKGILKAEGEYIILLDSDDKFADSNTLKNLFDVVQKYNTDVIINANLIEFTDNGKTKIIDEFRKDILIAPPTEIIKEYYIKPNLVFAGCFFVLKKNYLKNNKLFFKKGILHEDEHWWPRVLFRTKEIAVNHYPFYAYRKERDGSITSVFSAKKLYDLLDIINDLLTWSRDKKKYTREGCLFMRQKAKEVYDDVVNLNNKFNLHDKKNFNKINKILNNIFNKLPYNHKGKRLLLSKIIGPYYTEIIYKLYIKNKLTNKDNTTIFSIIIPVYKTEKYLNECIQSVLSQSFTDYECILVDDGSPDNCPSLCDDFSKKNNRIKVIHKENGGLGDARNNGILKAEGKYIILLDSDDKFADSNTLKNLFDVVQKYNSDVIINVNLMEFTDNGNIKIIDDFRKDILIAPPTEIIKEYYSKSSLYFAGWLFVLKKNYLINNKLFFKIGIIHEDEHWWPRVLFRTKEIAVNHYPFYAYRKERDGSITSVFSAKKLYDLLDIINDLLTYSRDKKKYTQEGCLFIRQKAEELYNDVSALNNKYNLHDKKYYNKIRRKLRNVFIKFSIKRLLLSRIIGSYNTVVIYKLYIRIKNKMLKKN